MTLPVNNPNSFPALDVVVHGGEVGVDGALLDLNDFLTEEDVDTHTSPKPGEEVPLEYHQRQGRLRRERAAQQMAGR